MLNLTPSRVRATPPRRTFYARIIGRVVHFLSDDRPRNAPMSSAWSTQVLRRFDG